MNFEFLHHSELILLKSLQSINGPFLNQLMLILNHCDTMPFYYLAIAATWYAYQRKLGMQLLLLFILGVIINQDCKILFSQPRPYHLDPSLGLLTVSFFGFPSGAAQVSLSFCGLIALNAKKRWVWFLSICFLIVVGFSRVYLGVHFPSDILGGWIIGALTLWGCYLTFPLLERFLYQNCLKNRNFDKEAPLNFDLERATIARGQGESENQNLEVKPTQSKTDYSDNFGINQQSKVRLVALSLLAALFLSFCAFSEDALLKVFFVLGACMGIIFAPPLVEQSSSRQKIFNTLLVLLGIYLLEKLSTLTRLHSAKELHFWTSAFFLFLIGFWLSCGVPLLLTKQRLTKNT